MSRPTDKSKYDSTYEKIFKDPEREAFDFINKCSNLEEEQECFVHLDTDFSQALNELVKSKVNPKEVQECLHREKDNRGWEFINKKNKYNPITTKQNYNTLLNSGMFWEFYPELTGVWEKDKDNILELINKKKK